MSVRVSCHIAIGKFEFDYVTEVEIESTWKRLTDTARIVLPRKIKWKDQNLKDLIKRGDEVEIWLGWDYDDRLEFKGYVSEVGSKIPVEIKCEDEMWKLKQGNIVKAWRSVKLAGMLAEILPGYQIKTVDADLGGFRINQVSAAKVLESLRETYGLYSFFRDGVLIVGFPYTLTKSQRVAYAFEKNIISDQLKYQREDDVRIKVKGISLNSDGTQETVQVGDSDGEQRTLHFFNLSKTQLKASTEEMMKLLRYTGYRGDFETFGVPFLRHSDIAEVRGGEYSERAGNYLVDRVKTTFGLGGFRREIELGRQV